MASHRVLAFISLGTLFSVASVAGCPGDPGTQGPSQLYGTTSSSSAGGAGGTGGIGGSGGIGGTPCECGPGLECCSEACVNVQTDILNCGGCGTVCPGPFPFCDAGMCAQWPCPDDDVNCEVGVCCGTQCCDLESGEVCCNIEVDGTVGPHCAIAQNNGTCPVP